MAFVSRIEASMSNHYFKLLEVESLLEVELLLEVQLLFELKL